MAIIMNFVKMCVLLIFFVCSINVIESNEHETVLVEKLNYTNKTLKKIGEDICNMFKGPDDPTCLPNWFGPPVVKELPKELNITEWGAETKFGISDTNSTQVVTIVADDESYVELFFLFPPITMSERVLLNDSMNYTFSTATVLENGTHSSWLQSPKLLARNNTHRHLKPMMNYTIDIELDYSKVLGCNCSIVTFTWNIRDESDRFFKVISDCQVIFRNHHYEKEIILEPNSTEAKFTRSVPLSGKCFFEVTPLDGRGKGVVFYKTEPQPVENITASFLANGDGWDIRVSWALPEKTPDKYLVTLNVEKDEYKEIVPGNATEATFYGVKEGGHSQFAISVCNYKGQRCRQHSVFTEFPRLELASSSVSVLGSILAVILLAIIVVCGAVGYRRRRHLKIKQKYFEEVPEVFPKKYLPEIITDLPVTKDSWEILPEMLQLHEVIGEGAFGVVRRGTLAPDKAVAVKMLKNYPTLDEVRSFRAEMELMKSVGAHSHVVSLVGCCSGQKPLIVAEYCSRGDLLTYLRCFWDVMVCKRNAKYCNNNLDTSNYRNDLFKAVYNEQSKLVINKMYDLNGACDVELTFVDLLSFCRQIAMGMEFLSSNRVVHRDLAARNILVTSDRTLKIADFGLSRDIYQENQYRQKGNGKMPVKWMALECLTHRIYTKQSDVWSFGVVMWEVVTVGGEPYNDVAATQLPRLLRSGYRMPQPNVCTKQLYDLMLACWQARPRDRPTFTELHTELDAMLQNACAEQYLALDLDIELKPEEPRSFYTRFMEFARGKRRRDPSYSYPLPRTHSNLYSSPPVSNKTSITSVSSVNSVPLCT